VTGSLSLSQMFLQYLSGAGVVVVQKIALKLSSLLELDDRLDGELVVVVGELVVVVGELDDRLDTADDELDFSSEEECLSDDFSELACDLDSE